MREAGSRAGTPRSALTIEGHGTRNHPVNGLARSCVARRVSCAHSINALIRVTLVLVTSENPENNGKIPLIILSLGLRKNDKKEEEEEGARGGCGGLRGISGTPPVPVFGGRPGLKS